VPPRKTTKTTTTSDTSESPVKATEKENTKLAHSEGGTTTRDDATDMGVPMLPGDGSEPVGPEDALGPGPKRGDYSQRLGETNYQPHEVRPRSDAKDGEPQVEVVAQAPRAAEQGDVAGRKGGVDTSEDDAS
jgi:hypothetical protein